jgi:hypothetical protein
MTDNITQIDENAFYNCVNLNDISLPSNLKKIGCNAFRQCFSLTTIVIPESVDFIGKYSFYESGLTSATIPTNKNWVVKSVPYYNTSRGFLFHTLENNGTATFPKLEGSGVGGIYSSDISISPSIMAKALKGPYEKSSASSYNYYEIYKCDWVISQ